MGRLRAASGLGRAHGGSLDSQLSYARSPRVDKLRTEAVRTEAVRCQGDTGVEATQGYPRRGVGDAVRGTRGRTISLEILVHSCGDEFQGSCGTSSKVLDGGRTP